MWKNPAGNREGCAVALNAPWSASTRTRSAGDPPVAGRRDLAAHVVVAGERRGHQVLRAVLHPLDRRAHHARGDHGAHVAGVEPDLVAEPAADVGRHDADPVLRDARHPREQHPVRVRGLRGRVHGELAGDRVVVGHDPAGLQRRRVHPRVDQVAGAHVLGGRERGVGGRGVARLPVEDVVVGLVAHARRVGVQRVAGVDDGGQRRVLDVDQRERVAGGVAGLRDDERDLLRPGSAPRRWRARPARRGRAWASRRGRARRAARR